jgi:hypothetical protein
MFSEVVELAFDTLCYLSGGRQAPLERIFNPRGLKSKVHEQFVSFEKGPHQGTGLLRETVENEAKAAQRKVARFRQGEAARASVGTILLAGIEELNDLINDSEGIL